MINCHRRITIPGLRLSPFPRDRKLLFISKSLSSRHMEHDIIRGQSRVPVSYCRMPAWTAVSLRALAICRVREARAMGQVLYGLRMVWSVERDALSLRRRCGYTSGRIRLHRPSCALKTIWALAYRPHIFSDTSQIPAQSRHEACMSLYRGYSPI